jgi:NTP pyrophosphatase (non-canonical NTP hydrolase)
MEMRKTANNGLRFIPSPTKVVHLSIVMEKSPVCPDEQIGKKKIKDKEEEMKDLCLKTSIHEKIREENIRQLKLWGVQEHEPFEWLAYVTEELGELSEAISEWTYRDGQVEDVVKEAIQVSTLSLKIAEMFENILVIQQHLSNKRHQAHVLLQTAIVTETGYFCPICGGQILNDTASIHYVHLLHNLDRGIGVNCMTGGPGISFEQNRRGNYFVADE